MKISIAAINEWIAAKSTMLMGTMWCVYTFTVWSLIPLVFTHLTPIVAYVSGDIIQLIALPLIMVGQQVLNRGSEKRAISDHKAIKAELELLKAENAKLDTILAKLDVLEKKLAASSIP